MKTVEDHKKFIAENFAFRPLNEVILGVLSSDYYRSLTIEERLEFVIVLCTWRIER